MSGMVTAGNMQNTGSNHASSEMIADGGMNRTRWFALAAAVAAAAVLVIAATLTPSESGHGTHQRLGLPPCGWIVSMGLPCPTCGMTTSFSHTVRGEWGEAFMAQPMGLVLCIVTAMVFVGGLVMAFTGAPLGRLLATAWNGWWTWGLIIMFVAAWGWKVAVHKEFV